MFDWHLIVLALILLILIFELLIPTIKSALQPQIPDHIIQRLIRQTARWAVAAEQDENPIIRLLHANYATGYLYALLDNTNKSEVTRATGIDINQFIARINQIQDKATKLMTSKCPVIAPKTKDLAKISGEGV